MSVAVILAVTEVDARTSSTDSPASARLASMASFVKLVRSDFFNLVFSYSYHGFIYRSISDYQFRPGISYLKKGKAIFHFEKSKS